MIPPRAGDARGWLRRRLRDHVLSGIAVLRDVRDGHLVARMIVESDAEELVCRVLGEARRALAASGRERGRFRLELRSGAIEVDVKAPRAA